MSGLNFLSECVALFTAIHLLQAFELKFSNLCIFTINLYDNVKTEPIKSQCSINKPVSGPGLMWRHGENPQATIVEFTEVNDGKIWYDIGIIPPGPGWCKSHADCKLQTGRTGFNVPVAIIPTTLDGIYTSYCRPIYCLADGCEDAYQFPEDNSKTHDCAASTTFEVIFCPNPPLDSTTSQFISVTAAAPQQSTFQKANFHYSNQQAGNIPGTYNMVMDLATCSTARQDIQSPVGPLSEEVSLVLRGPMEIEQIVIFSGVADGNPAGQYFEESAATPIQDWHKVSWYSRTERQSHNILFFNNMNIDYSAQTSRGPQTFASSDGRTAASLPQEFGGILDDASDLNWQVSPWGGPGVSTGVEVNILTARQCLDTDSDQDKCKGFHNPENNYHGWNGGRKIFVTKVRMPHSSNGPDLPAIWLLNAQVLYSGQYGGCNCRGIGKAGGCGELDIAEVIEQNNPDRRRISTHYYFYDGNVVHAPFSDNFADRPTDDFVIYITIIDDRDGGHIKIVQVDDFPFEKMKLTDLEVQMWLNT